MVSTLPGRLARCLAVLILIAGLLGAAAPAPMAAPAMPAEHAAMDCDHGGHRQAPPRHLPNAADCCMASACAMGLALPATASGIALPGCAEMPGYDLRAPLAPAGVAPAPIPHPPKTPA